MVAVSSSSRSTWPLGALTPAALSWAIDSATSRLVAERRRQDLAVGDLEGQAATRC